MWVLNKHSWSVLAIAHTVRKSIKNLALVMHRTPHWSLLSIKEFCLLGVWLEGTLWLNTRTVNKLLSLLPSLSVLVKTIKLSISAPLGWVSHFLLFNHLCRGLSNLWLKADSLCLLAGLFDPLRIDFVLYCLTILYQKVFRFFVVESFHIPWNSIDFGFESISI